MEYTIKQIQKLINSGDIWKFEGAMGRLAMQLLKEDKCILGKVGRYDYWGNYVPSRFEVKKGTLGSIEYRKNLKDQII